VHVASTGKLTYYGYEGGRGRAAIEAIAIVPNCRAVIVRDAYPAYDTYQQCKHSLCNVHLLRDLTYAIEGSPTHKQWAEPMKGLLQEIKQAVEQAKAEGRRRLTKQQEQQYQDKYEEFVNQGWELKGLRASRAGPTECRAEGEGESETGADKQGSNLVVRLKVRQEEILRIMREFRVPFDNNQVEREVRMIKLDQKIGGCFRSEEEAVSAGYERGS
jgi:transposase